MKPEDVVQAEVKVKRDLDKVDSSVDQLIDKIEATSALTA